MAAPFHLPKLRVWATGEQGYGLFMLSIQSCHINDMDKQCTWSKFRITCSSSSVVDIVLVLMVPLERFLTSNKSDTCFGILDVQFGCTLWMYKLDVQFDGTS